MLNQELYYSIALQNTEKIGVINARKMLAKVGSAKGIFEEKPFHLLKIEGIGTTVINSLKNKQSLAVADKEMAFINNHDVLAHTILDSNYPQRLLHCPDAPIVLYTKGKMDLNEEKVISIVGTRNMTLYGKRFIAELIEELKVYKVVVVSGLAYGVDICAHQEAIKNKITTVAVLAHGLDRIYPKVHTKEAIAMQDNGGLITEFGIDTNPDRENFIKRNRIVAGLSQATVVIESAEKGGSLITAQLANSYHRDVFAVPGRTSDLYSKGCNHLIKTNQAHLLESAKDLAYILNWQLDKKKKLVQPKLFVDLNSTEQKLCDYLKENGKQHIDLIALSCKMSISQAAINLLQLELKGIVKPLPGKLFELF